MEFFCEAPVLLSVDVHRFIMWYDEWQTAGEKNGIVLHDGRYTSAKKLTCIVVARLHLLGAFEGKLRLHKAELPEIIQL